jgi:hypothetical protein
VVIGACGFLAGMVIAAQGVIGKEISSEGRVFGRDDPDHPGVHHAPERHRLRLFLAGVGLMVVSVAVIAIFT